MYEWLFAPPGAKPASWDEKRAAVALEQAIESHDSVVLVADDGGTLVGFCTAYQDIHSVRFGYRAWVEDLAVDPGRRSEGIGKALLDAAKAWARGARGDPPRARLGRVARRRPPLLRARGRRVPVDQLRLGALSG